MSTIQNLVDQYNATEAGQNETLRQICALLFEQTGPRRLVVADEAVQDFSPLAVSSLLNRLNRGISKVEEGL